MAERLLSYTDKFFPNLGLNLVKSSRSRIVFTILNVHEALFAMRRYETFIARKGYAYHSNVNFGLI